MNTKWMSSIAVVVAMGVVAAHVSAATIVQTQNFGPSQSNINQAFAFDQFDDNGGAWTLQGIEIIVQLEGSGGYREVTNLSSEEATTADVEFGLQGGISSTDVSLQGIGSFLAAVNSAFFNLGPSATQTLIGGNISDSGDGFVSEDGWTTGSVGFLGSETYDIVVSVLNFTSVTGSGIEDTGQTPTGGGSVTVIYHFIPEPASIALLGLGSMLILSRRRK